MFLLHERNAEQIHNMICNKPLEFLETLKTISKKKN